MRVGRQGERRGGEEVEGREVLSYTPLEKYLPLRHKVLEIEWSLFLVLLTTVLLHIIHPFL
jgi:hypothetical protein